MTPRLDYTGAAAPEAMNALIGIERYLAQSGIEPSLLHLIKLRASQINGCAFCLDLHAREARDGGESQARLDVLCAWRETALFTERERAALAWTEALTLVAESHAPDADYEAARTHFSDRELVDLTLAIGMINLWNRFGVGFRRQPDPSYRTASRATTQTA